MFYLVKINTLNAKFDKIALFISQETFIIVRWL